jgi:hypothetical protein
MKQAPLPTIGQTHRVGFKMKANAIGLVLLVMKMDLYLQLRSMIVTPTRQITMLEVSLPILHYSHHFYFFHAIQQ